MKFFCFGVQNIGKLVCDVGGALQRLFLYGGRTFLCSFFYGGRAFTLLSGRGRFWGLRCGRGCMTARRFAGLSAFGGGDVKGDRPAVGGGDDGACLVGSVHLNAGCPEGV